MRKLPHIERVRIYKTNEERYRRAHSSFALYLVFCGVLFERAHLEIVHFLLCEVAPASAGQVLLCESCEVHSVEFHYMVAERLEYAAHDAVAARVKIGRASCRERV